MPDGWGVPAPANQETAPRKSSRNTLLALTSQMEHPQRAAGPGDTGLLKGGECEG